MATNFFTDSAGRTTKPMTPEELAAANKAKAGASAPTMQAFGISRPGGIATGGGGGVAGFMSGVPKVKTSPNGGYFAKAPAQTPVQSAPVSQPTPVASMPEPAPAPSPEPVAQPTPQPAAQPSAPMVQPPAPQQESKPTMRPSDPAPTRAPFVPQTPAAPQQGAGQMANDLYQRAIQAMNSPSRYDADLVKQGAAVIEDTINRMRQTGTRNVGEWAASRGLVGSSLEGERMTDLESELNRSGREQLFNLQREQANTYGADRNSAFGMGLGSAGLGESVAARLGQEDYQNRALNQSGYFQNEQLGYQDRALAQNQNQFNANQDYQNRSLDADTRLRQQGIDLQGRGLDQNQVAQIADLVGRYGPDILDQLGLGDAKKSTTNFGPAPTPSGKF